MRKAQITHLGCLIGQMPWQNHFKSIGPLENTSPGLSPPCFHRSICVTLFVLLLSITVATLVGPEGTGRLSLCPVSPCLVPRWGDQQDLAARDPRVLPKHCGAGWEPLHYGYFLLLLSFPDNFWLCRPPNALNRDMARLYVNFKLADKRFAFLLTSHGSFAR